MYIGGFHSDCRGRVSTQVKLGTVERILDSERRGAACCGNPELSIVAQSKGTLEELATDRPVRQGEGSLGSFCTKLCSKFQLYNLCCNCPTLPW